MPLSFQRFPDFPEDLEEIGVKDLVALVSLSRSDLFVDQRFFSSSAVAFIVRENDLKFLIQGFFVSSRKNGKTRGRNRRDRD